MSAREVDASYVRIRLQIQVGVDSLCSVKLAFSPYVLKGMRLLKAYARLIVYASTSRMYMLRLMPLADLLFTILRICGTFMMDPKTTIPKPKPFDRASRMQYLEDTSTL